MILPISSGSTLSSVGAGTIDGTGGVGSGNNHGIYSLRGSYGANIALTGIVDPNGNTGEYSPLRIDGFVADLGPYGVHSSKQRQRL